MNNLRCGGRRGQLRFREPVGRSSNTFGPRCSSLDYIARLNNPNLRGCDCIDRLRNCKSQCAGHCLAESGRWSWSNDCRGRVDAGRCVEGVRCGGSTEDSLRISINGIALGACGGSCLINVLSLLLASGRRSLRCSCVIESSKSQG